MTQKTPPNFSAHLAMFSVSLMYGINYFTAKVAFSEGLSPFAALSVRAMVAGSVFFLFHTFFIKEKIQKPRDYGYLLLCALFGVSINQTFYLWGLSKTTPLNAGVLMITTPVFVVIFARLLKTESFNARKLTGLALSFIGAFMLISGGKIADLGIGTDTLDGDLMIMLNAASYGVYLVLVRPLILRYNTFTIIKWIFLFGGAINFCVGFPAFISTEWSGFSGEVWFGLAFLVVFATLAAYFLNAWAMKKLPSSAVGMYIYVQPVFVTLISGIFFEGVVTFAKLVFILIIFAGVWLVTGAKLSLSKSKVSE